MQEGGKKVMREGGRTGCAYRSGHKVLEGPPARVPYRELNGGGVPPLDDGDLRIVAAHVAPWSIPLVRVERHLGNPFVLRTHVPHDHLRTGQRVARHIRVARHMTHSYIVTHGGGVASTNMTCQRENSGPCGPCQRDATTPDRESSPKDANLRRDG